MNHISIISFIGYSKSGKTESISSLVRFLTRNRFHAIVLKKTTHKQPIFDTPGKNTWQFSRAGATAVVGVSDVETALFLNTPLQNEKLEAFLVHQLTYLRDSEDKIKLILLMEGFRQISTNQVLCTANLTDIHAQVPDYPRIRAISGSICSKLGNFDSIREEFSVPTIDCLNDPKSLCQLFGILD